MLKIVIFCLFLVSPILCQDAFYQIILPEKDTTHWGAEQKNFLQFLELVQDLQIELRNNKVYLEIVDVIYNAIDTSLVPAWEKDTLFNHKGKPLPVNKVACDKIYLKLSDKNNAKIDICQFLLPYTNAYSFVFRSRLIFIHRQKISYVNILVLYDGLYFDIKSKSKLILTQAKTVNKLAKELIHYSLAKK